MDIFDLYDNGRHGEVYESELDRSEVEVHVSEEGLKSIIWFKPMMNDFGYEVGQPIHLDDEALSGEWARTEKVGNFIDQQKFKLSRRWFWMEKTKGTKLLKEANKTIEMLKKLGYKVAIEEPDWNRFDNLVIWVIAKNPDGEIIFGFKINKKTRELDSTFLTLRSKSKAIQEIKKSKEFTYGAFERNKNQDLLEPMTLLQKMRLKLIFN